MDIQLNDKTVRAMAERLRSAIGGEQLPQGKALEALSLVFGYKNWDTLSGMLKREAQPKFRLAVPVELYVGAFSTDEFGSAPRWAQVTLDQAFIDKVLAMQALCVGQDLTETPASVEPERWQGDDSEDPWNIQGAALCVGPASWWFSGFPKHCSYTVETRMIDINSMLTVLAKKTSTEHLAWFKDLLVYDSSGEPTQMLEALVDEDELLESYLPS